MNERNGAYLLLLALLSYPLTALAGCGSSPPMPYFSGEFSVSSKYGEPIIIKDWQGFGAAQPARGYIIPEADKIVFFPKLDRLPESTVVSWVLESDENGEVFSQEIDLKGVVPPNTEGQTEFTFGEDGKWTVRFVPAAE